MLRSIFSVLTATVVIGSLFVFGVASAQTEDGTVFERVWWAEETIAGDIYLSITPNKHGDGWDMLFFNTNATLGCEGGEAAGPIIAIDKKLHPNEDGWLAGDLIPKCKKLSKVDKFRVAVSYDPTIDKLVDEHGNLWYPTLIDEAAFTKGALALKDSKPEVWEFIDVILRAPPDNVANPPIACLYEEDGRVGHQGFYWIEVDYFIGPGEHQLVPVGNFFVFGATFEISGDAEFVRPPGGPPWRFDVDLTSTFGTFRIETGDPGGDPVSASVTLGGRECVPRP